MSIDQTPPRPGLKRQVAQATLGFRMALARGFIGMLGLKIQPVEPQRPPRDLRPKPAPVQPAAAAPVFQPKPAEAPKPAAAAPTAPAAPKFTPEPPPPPTDKPDKFFPERGLRVDACPVCGDALAELVSDEYCPSCNTPGRTRVLPPLLENVVGPVMETSPARDLPLLGFAMAGVELKLLDPYFPNRTSVSLFGSYGKGHILGVDARDLSRFEDNSFSGHFSILLFDYFTEQEQGIRDAYRVLAPGGVFMTELGPYRLKDGWDAPYQVKEVRGRPGYFEYLPEGVALADIRVGRQWFLQAMEDAGFEVRWVQVHDRATGKDLDWFVGVKPPV